MKLYAGVIPLDERGLAALQQRDDVPSIENPGMITTFGGLAEPGEEPADAAIREAAEELGLRISRNSLIGLIEHEKRIPDSSAVTWCVIFYVPVPDVSSLRTTEGTGVIVGPPAELLGHSRLTDVCRHAVIALTVLSTNDAIG